MAIMNLERTFFQKFNVELLSVDNDYKIYYLIITERQ